MHLSRYHIIVIAGLLLGLLLWYFWPYFIPGKQPAGTKNCPDLFQPVCGNDGLTYDNGCLAQAAGVDIASDGACFFPDVPSNLTAEERQYLTWLLVARKDQGLSQLPVQHYHTLRLADNASSDMIMYFRFEPDVIVSLTIRGDEVTEALDSTGYDYLKKDQGAPVDYLALFWIEGDIGDVCGQPKEKICAQGLGCIISNESKVATCQPAP